MSEPIFAHAEWQRYLADGQLPPGLDPLVARSWRRCAPRINPLQQPNLAKLAPNVLGLFLQRNHQLRTIAQPIIEDLTQQLEGHAIIALLLDSTNCILDHFGDPKLLSELGMLGLMPGAFCDESRIGANAFATALIERSPLMIAGAEHFVQWLHPYNAAAAPIFALNGAPLAVIGFLEARPWPNRLLLGVATAAARAIESQLHAELLMREALERSSTLNAILDAISDGVLVWNEHGLISQLNDRAGLLLGVNPATIVGGMIGERLHLPESVREAAASGHELRDTEAQLLVDGTPHELVISLRTIPAYVGNPALSIATLRRAEEVRQLVNRISGAQARLSLNDIVGESPTMRRVRREAARAARANACVLLVGQEGTGKSVIARAIHNSSARTSEPFVTVNCRGLPRELLLGELIGYAPGWRGSASEGQPGKLELANGGTLYLNEIDALPPDAQAALLRAIETGEVLRLGSTRPIAIDTRLIASTSSNLDQLVAERQMRADLSYRLRALTIAIPPLTVRRDDLPMLIDHSLRGLGERLGQPLRVADECYTVLAAYPWPGNIRELETVLERAALLCGGGPIELAHLPEALREPRVLSPDAPLSLPVPSLDELEVLAIKRALRAANGNLSRTAQLLGIGRTTLWRKLRHHQISTD